MYNTEDLERGARFNVAGGNWVISHHPVSVEVRWVDDKDVYYTVGDSRKVRSTPIQRFLEVVNATYH